MEETDKFEVIEDTENINKEKKLKLRKAKKEKKVKKDTKAEITKEMLWEQRKERILKPFLKAVVLAAVLILFVMTAWAVISPGAELRQLYQRDLEITDKVTSELRIKELEAEVESLRAELADREREISELSQRLGQASVMAGTEPPTENAVPAEDVSE